MLYSSVWTLILSILLLDFVKCNGENTTCPNSHWDDMGSTCLLYKNGEVKTWSEAKDSCFLQGGVLASVLNQEENERISQGMSPNNLFWIGMIGKNNEYPRWLDNTPSQYWPPGGQIALPPTGQKCVTSTNTGVWSAFLCGIRLPYVCKATKVSTSDWTEHEGKLYQVINTLTADTMSWHRSSAVCNSMGGNLVSVHSQAQNDFITNLLRTKNYNNRAWMGLHMIDRLSFGWTDWTNASFVNWAPGAPSTAPLHELCATISNPGAGKWQTANCGLTAAAICWKDPNNVDPVIPVTPVKVPGYCPVGYVESGIDANKCFKLVFLENDVDGVTWDQALAICRQGPGVRPDLASIQHTQENALITSRMTPDTRGLWFGLKRVLMWTGNRAWNWVDNSEYGYKNWGQASRSYSNVCGFIWSKPGPMGTWSFLTCTKKLGYVCQTFKDANTVVPTPDPALQPSQICRPGYAAYLQGCYKLVKSPRTWEAARTYCIANGGDLVSMHSAAENSIVQMIAAFADGGLWIGMSKNEDDEWAWTNKWYVLYTNWAPGYPGQQNDTCVLLDYEGKWVITNCTEKLQFVCEITDAPAVTPPTDINGTCPVGSRWLEFGNRCYLFDETKGTWAQAVDKCKKYAAWPLSIHHATENHFIETQIKKKTSTYKWWGIWLGIYRSKQDGEFRWVDGNSVQYTRWVPDTSSSSRNYLCGIYYAGNTWTGWWKRESCARQRYIVCSVLKGVPTTSLPRTPGQCPSDDWEEYENTCFKYYPDALSTWDQGNTNCSGQGGHLATIHSRHQNIHIYERMMSASHLPINFNYWIGMQRMEKGGDYVWVDGSEVDFTAWNTGEPNEDTAIQEVQVKTSSSGANLWNDHSGSELGGFVCQTDKVLLDSDYQASTSQSSTLSTSTIIAVAVGLLIGTMVLAILIFLVIFWHKKGVLPTSFREARLFATNKEVQSSPFQTSFKTLPEEMEN